MASSSTFSNGRVFAALLAPLALLAFSAVIWASPYGLGVNNDSIHYLAAAKSALAGQGFRGFDGAPLTHFPVGFPALLAFVGFFCEDVSQGAIVLSATMFAANTSLVGLAVFFATGRNVSVSLLAAMLFALFPGMVHVHLIMLSEPPFMTFSLLSVILLSAFLSNRNMPLLMMSALSMSAALALRYAGLALIPPTLFAILRFGSGAMQQRLRDSVIYLSVAISPILLIMANNRINSGTATHRELAFHPPTSNDLGVLFENAHKVVPFLPSALIVPLVLVIGVALLSAVMLLLRRRNARTQQTLPFAKHIHSWIAIFIPSYLLFVLLSKSFVDAHIPFDWRLLSPLFPFLTILACSVSWGELQSSRKPSLLYGAIVCCLLVVGANAFRSIKLADDMRQKGVGYTSRKWAASECVNYVVHEVPAGTAVYSNAPAGLWLLAGIESKLLPRRINPFTRRPNPSYEQEMHDLCDAVQRQTAIVMFFDEIEFYYLPTKDELTRDWRLIPSPRLADGAIYRVVAETPNNAP